MVPRAFKGACIVTHRSIACVIPPALLLAVAMSPAALGRDPQAAVRNGVHPLYASDAGLATHNASDVSARVAQPKGRYKKQGKTCEWDATDSGPNQCTPLTKGRFKKTGDTCSWAFNDTGPDQCRPAQGRWTKCRTRCVWRPNDTGPDQCNPRQPR